MSEDFAPRSDLSDEMKQGAELTPASADALEGVSQLRG